MVPKLFTSDVNSLKEKQLFGIKRKKLKKQFELFKIFTERVESDEIYLEPGAIVLYEVS